MNNKIKKELEMKLTKQERDAYVLKNYMQETNKQLVEHTGWSLTTIKSSLTRQGLARRANPQLEEAKEYILSHLHLSNLEIAETLGCKIDKVRNLKAAMECTEVQELQNRLEDMYKDTFILGRYTGNKNPIDFECKTCGDKGTTRADRFSNQEKVCTPCNRVAKGAKTKAVGEEIRLLRKIAIRATKKRIKQEELQKWYQGFTIQYIKNVDKIIKECNSCSSRYYTAAGRGSRTKCNDCHADIQHEEAVTRLKEMLKTRGMELLSEYVTGRVPILIRCSNGHTRRILPATATTCSCPMCIWGAPCSIYVLSSAGGILKVGISNNVRRRLLELNNAWVIEWELVQEYPVKTRAVAVQIEQKVHRLLQNKRAFSEGSDGYTEVFRASVQDTCTIVQNLVYVL